MTQMDKVEMLQWLEIKIKQSLSDCKDYTIKGDMREADKCLTKAAVLEEVVKKLVSIL